MSLIANIFKKKYINQETNNALNNLAKSINNATSNKQDLEDFILILKQIQDINNAKAEGKGSVLKNYLQRKIAIENATSFAIEKYNKKIEEIDTANI